MTEQSNQTALRLSHIEAALLSLSDAQRAADERLDRVDRVVGWDAKPAPVDMRGFRSARGPFRWAFKSARRAGHASL